MKKVEIHARSTRDFFFENDPVVEKKSKPFETLLAKARVTNLKHEAANRNPFLKIIKDAELLKRNKK